MWVILLKYFKYNLKEYYFKLKIIYLYFLLKIIILKQKILNYSFIDRIYIHNSILILNFFKNSKEI